MKDIKQHIKRFTEEERKIIRQFIRALLNAETFEEYDEIETQFLACDPLVSESPPARGFVLYFNSVGFLVVFIFSTSERISETELARRL